MKTEIKTPWVRGLARAAAGLCALLSAAVGAAQEGYPLTVRDDQGTPVTVARYPVRIVSLATHTDDILVELVDHRRLLAVTRFAADPALSNVFSSVEDIPHKLTMNVEMIIALQPDLVFVADWTETDRVQQLRGAGVPVFRSASPLGFERIAAAIRSVALLVGERRKGEEMIARMDRRLQAVWERVGALPAAERRSVLDYSTWGAAQGRGSSWDELVRRAGLVNAAARFPADRWGQVPLSREMLLELDPDILILPGWTYGDPAGSDAFFRQVVEDPALGTLRAVREGRVYRLPEGLKAATSQFAAQAVERLARLAYPELFP